MAGETQLELDLLKTPGPAEYIEVPVAALPTMLRGPDPTAEFLSTVRNLGVVCPITLRRGEDGRYQVEDGNRRIKAARILGIETLRAIVLTNGYWSPVVTLVLNAQRSANAAAEYEAIVALMNAGADEAKVAEATGMPLGTIRKRLKLGLLKEELLLTLYAGKLSYPLAHRIAGLPPLEQELLWQVYQDKGKVTAADVREVTQARKGAAQLALGGVLESTEASWQFRVRSLLEQAAAIAEDEDLAEAITNLAQDVASD